MLGLFLGGMGSPLFDKEMYLLDSQRAGWLLLVMEEAMRIDKAFINYRMGWESKVSFSFDSWLPVGPLHTCYVNGMLCFPLYQPLQ